jgi:GTPase
LALSKNDQELVRKGMVVLEHSVESSLVFEAEMVILKCKGVDGATIRQNYETMVHVLHVKEFDRIESIEVISAADGGHRMEPDSTNSVLRPGSKVRVTFRFLQQKVT